MSAKDFIIPPGEGAVWHMAPGRSATLKITSDIAQSVMMFEEVAPTDTVTNLTSIMAAMRLLTFLAAKSPS